MSQSQYAWLVIIIWRKWLVILIHHPLMCLIPLSLLLMPHACTLSSQCFFFFFCIRWMLCCVFATFVQSFIALRIATFFLCTSLVHTIYFSRHHQHRWIPPHHHYQSTVHHHRHHHHRQLPLSTAMHLITPFNDVSAKRESSQV